MQKENKVSTTDLSVDQSNYAIVRQKLVVVGDVSVGKTAIVNCFIENRFKETYEVNFILILAFCRS